MRKKIINFRKNKNLTQASVANSLGISRQYYAKIESGERTPSFKKALIIKKFFDYYDDDIFDNSEDIKSI